MQIFIDILIPFVILGPLALVPLATIWTFLARRRRDDHPGTTGRQYTGYEE